MAAATQPNVTTAATLIATNTAEAASITNSDDYSARTFRVKNVTATAAVILGGTNGVTAANGYSWAVADGPLLVTLEQGESLYGIVAATAQQLHVLQTGR